MKTQVTVVGGGPVGLGLAIELGRRGIRCVVVERRVQPQRIPKGQNLTQRTMEHFRAWGAESELRAARPIPPSFGIGGLTAYGSLLSGYAYDWLQREIVRPYYAADNERLPQYETERVLRDRAAGFDAIDVRLGWQLDSLSATDDRVTARITRVTPGGDGAASATSATSGASEANPASETSETIDSDYLVGCDGSRSAVREAVGIDQALSDHDRLMVLLVFRSRGLDDLLRQRFPGKSYFSVLHPDLQGYWRFFGRVDLAPTWFFHAPVPRGTTEHNTDFRRLLHEAAGAPFDVEFQHIGYWDLRFAIARRYAQGRVMLAGDAAHSHPPYGGYGVNTGFEDARNLGWKLAAALQGWAGPGLLPSYDAERRPVFESTARDFIEKSIFADRDFLARFNPARDRAAFEREWAARASGARDEVGSFEPHYEGSPIAAAGAGGDAGAAAAAGSPGALGSHQVRARAGHHLTPLRLDEARGVYDALSDGFSLLVIGADEGLVRSFEDAARRLGLPLTVVRSSPAGDCARYEAALVLVRPDHFVAWCGRGDGSVDPVRVLRRAVGA